jgi:hypothetical protein
MYIFNFFLPAKKKMLSAMNLFCPPYKFCEVNFSLINKIKSRQGPCFFDKK